MYSGTRVLNNKQIEWAYQKWCEGHPIWQIAQALNVCEKTVKRAIGIRPRIYTDLVYDGKE